MKLTSHLSLLLFLQLAATAPLQVVLPADCKHYSACQSHLRHDPRPATPPTTLSDPHFPSHQLAGTRPSSSDTTDEDPSNNALTATTTPLSRTSPSAALSATRPLTTAYLLSLINSPHQEEPNQDEQEREEDNKLPLPAKPTSSLSQLRKLDSIRYLASLRFTLPVSTPDNTAKITVAPISRAQCAPIAPSAYERIGQYQSLALDNSDLLVVGIVVLFLAIVVVVELVQKVLEWRARIFGKWRRSAKGEIYLPDDEEDEWIPETPFFLLPPPPPRSKFTPAAYNDQCLKRDIGIVNEKCELPAEDVRR